MADGGRARGDYGTYRDSHSPAREDRDGEPSATTVPCASPQLTSEYQIEQCLESKIRVVRVRMESSLRDESDYFHYATRSQDRRVAQRTQSTFTSYAREECLALTNPTNRAQSCRFSMASVCSGSTTNDWTTYATRLRLSRRAESRRKLPRHFRWARTHAIGSLHATAPAHDPHRGGGVRVRMDCVARDRRHVVGRSNVVDRAGHLRVGLRGLRHLDNPRLDVMAALVTGGEFDSRSTLPERVVTAASRTIAGP